MRHIVRKNNPTKRKGELEQLQQLQQLLQLEQLQQLERLQRLQQLCFYNKSYEQIEIKEDSIVYCDIPYEGTAEYDKNKTFNRSKFLNWAAEINSSVYISEYNISDARFKVARIRDKRSIKASKTKNNKALIKKEKIYVNEYGYNKYYKNQ